MAEAGAGPSLPKRSLKHGRVKQPGGGGSWGSEKEPRRLGSQNTPKAEGEGRDVTCGTWKKLGGWRSPVGGVAPSQLAGKGHWSAQDVRQPCFSALTWSQRCRCSPLPST